MEHLDTALNLLALTFLILVSQQLSQIKDLLLLNAGKPKASGLKTGILQTLSGRVFTVKEKRKVVYNDDQAAWKKEKVDAGEIPDS